MSGTEWGVQPSAEAPAPLHPPLAVESWAWPRAGPGPSVVQWSWIMCDRRFMSFFSKSSMQHAPRPKGQQTIVQTPKNRRIRDLQVHTCGMHLLTNSIIGALRLKDRPRPSRKATEKPNFRGSSRSAHLHSQAAKTKSKRVSKTK